MAEVKAATEGHGADVILDNMGASYLARNVDALATEGRLLVIGLMGGTKGEIDLDQLMTKRGALISTRLRPRPVEEKAAICAAVVEHVWPLVADGRVRPVVNTSMPLAEAGRGARADDVGRGVGKDPSHRFVTLAVSRVGGMSQQPEHAPDDAAGTASDGSERATEPRGDRGPRRAAGGRRTRLGAAAAGRATTRTPRRAT